MPWGLKMLLFVPCLQAIGLGGMEAGAGDWLLAEHM